MTEQELLQLRREKWRLDARPVATAEDARDFLDSIGFCLLYPERRLLLVPTFVGACAGNDDRLPSAKQAFADPRAREATDLMVRLLRERAAYEASLFGDNIFLLSAGVFPFFYGLVGDRNPRQIPKPGTHSEYSPLARDILEAIRQHGAMSKLKLQEVLGGALTPQALDRALGELWSRLRITRVDYKEGEGAYWDSLFKWSPAVVREGVNLSVPQALSALVSKYLDCVIAAEPSEVSEFFGHFVARSKVNDAINALLAARELNFVPVGNKSMLQVTPPRPATPSRSRQQPIYRRNK